MEMLLLLLAGVVSGVFASCPSKDTVTFDASHLDFAEDLYNEVSETTSGNFLISPLSAHIMLALLQTGSKGETTKRLSRVLHLPENAAAVKDTFRKVMINLQVSRNITLASANKVFLRHGTTISRDFHTTAVHYFHAEVDNMDFTNAAKAASKINKWVKHKTHGKIRDLVDPSAISSHTVAVLVNTLFFRAAWKNKFPEENTTERPFHVDATTTVYVDTMHVDGPFEYLNTRDAKYLRISYEGSVAKLTIVLPKHADGSHKLGGHIYDGFFSRNYVTRQVEVEIPKFKIETSMGLKPILESLGLVHVFGGKGDFTGITEEGENVPVDAVLQKTFIELNENGTVAAAATSVDLKSPTHRPEVRFFANHPFTFFISFRNTLLFVGRYVAP